MIALFILSVGGLVALVAGICWCGREVRRIVNIDSKLYPISDLRQRQIDNEIARGLVGSPQPADTATGYIEPDPAPVNGIVRPVLDRAMPEGWS